MAKKIIENAVLRNPASEGIAPIWNKDCKVLMIGSITSVDGMKMGFLYGSRFNQFWQLIDYCLGIDTASESSFSALKRALVDNYKNAPSKDILEANKIKIREQFKSRLLSHHIAMCDIFKSCYFNGGGSADSDIILGDNSYPAVTYKDLLTEIINSSKVDTVIVNSSFVEKHFLDMNIPGDYKLKKVPTPVQRFKKLEEKQKLWKDAFLS